MAKVTEGILINVEYGSIKTKETIDKKVVMVSDREYSLVTLDIGDKFHLSGNSGHELEAVGIGSKLKVTQDDGTIIIETVRRDRTIQTGLVNGIHELICLSLSACVPWLTSVKPVDRAACRTSADLK